MKLISIQKTIRSDADRVTWSALVTIYPLGRMLTSPRFFRGRRLSVGGSSAVRMFGLMTRLGGIAFLVRVSQ